MIKKTLTLLFTFHFMLHFTCEAQNLANLKDRKPLTFHGNISAGLNYYNAFTTVESPVSNTSFGSTPAWFVQGNAVLTIYGFAVPASMMLASQNESFNTPFNRFGMSPYFKWVKIHLGWRSLNFSQFTLAGQQILGAGFELTPGKFKVGIMYGTFNKAVTDISFYNNLNNNPPLYKRKGFATRIGYGTQKNFIELSYLQASDDTNDVSGLFLDTLFTKPAANQVLGLKGEAVLVKPLSAYIDVAASFYTNNIADDMLSINWNSPLSPLFSPKTSSRLSFGGEAGLKYRFTAGDIRLRVRRIDPNFKSMGAFYMQTDLLQYTVGWNFKMLKNKVQLQSDFGIEKNNLYKTAVSDSRRTIGNIGISYSLSSAFGINLRYSNYGISQQIIPQLQDPATIVKYDSVRISQVNQSIFISPHLFINKKTIQHSLSLQTSLQKLRNNNIAQSNQDYTSTMTSMIYSLIFPEKHITISNTLNYYNTVLTGNKSSVTGYNFGMTKTISTDEGKAKTFFNNVSFSICGGFFSNRLNGKSTGSTISISPGMNIGFLKSHSLQFNLNYSKSNNKSLASSKGGGMISIRYGMSF